MHRLEGQAGAEESAIAFDHADAAYDIVDQLVAAAKDLRRDGRPSNIAG
jgi:hypothetical protein